MNLAVDFTLTQPAKDRMTERLTKINFVVATAAALAIGRGMQPDDALPLAVAMVSNFLDANDLTFGDPAIGWNRLQAHAIAEDADLLFEVNKQARALCFDRAYAEAVAIITEWPEICPEGYITIPGALAADLAAYAQAVADRGAEVVEDETCEGGHRCRMRCDECGWLDEDPSPPRVYVVAECGNPGQVAAIHVTRVGDDWFDALDGQPRDLGGSPPRHGDCRARRLTEPGALPLTGKGQRLGSPNPLRFRPHGQTTSGRAASTENRHQVGGRRRVGLGTLSMH